MPGPISKDSISQYEAPSMLYDATRRPTAPLKAVANSADSIQDTIETTQQRMNREALERFQNTSSRMPHHSFVVVVQVGKYMFLAIMLPTYICFYGVPRWLLMNALPQLFIAVKTEVLRIGKFFSELKKRVVDRMQGVLSQLIGDSVRAFKQRTRKLLENISDKRSLSMEGMRSFINALQEQIKNARLSLLRARKYGVNKASDLLHKMRQAKDRAVRTAHTILSPLDVIDQYLISPVIAWTKKNILAATNIIKRGSSTARRLFKKTCDPIFSRAQQMMQAVYHSIYQLTQPVINRLQLYVENVRLSMQRSKEKISNSLSKVGLTASSKAKVVVLTIADQVQAIIQQPIPIILQLTGWSWRQGSRMVKRQWQYLHRGKQGAQKAMSFIGNALVDGAKAIGKKAQKIIGKILQQLHWLFHRMKLMLGWLWNQFITLPKKFFRVLKWLVKMMLSGIRQSIYGMRLLLAWAWVISTCGMVLVRELAQEIGSWFNTIYKK